MNVDRFALPLIDEILEDSGNRHPTFGGYSEPRLRRGLGPNGCEVGSKIWRLFRHLSTLLAIRCILPGYQLTDRTERLRQERAKC